MMNLKQIQKAKVPLRGLGAFHEARNRLNNLKVLQETSPSLSVYRAEDLKVYLNHAIPNRAAGIPKALYEAGFDAYIVGGAIRDILVNRKPTDIDISTAAVPDQVQAVFGKRCRIIGRRFILCLVRNRSPDLYDVSTFRDNNEQEEWMHLQFEKQRKKFLALYQGRDSHRIACLEAIRLMADEDSNNYLSSSQAITADADDLPFVSGKTIAGSNNFCESLLVDAQRRDFTINALYGDLVNDLIIDPYDGVKHLAEKRLVSVINPWLSMVIDPMRIIRALNAASKLDLDIDQDLHLAIFDCKNYLRTVATDRLVEYLIKCVTGGTAMKFMHYLIQYNIVAQIHPFLNRIVIEELIGKASLNYIPPLRPALLNKLESWLFYFYKTMQDNNFELDYPPFLSPTMVMIFASSLVTDTRVKDKATVNPAFILASFRVISFLEAYSFIRDEYRKKDKTVTLDVVNSLLDNLFSNIHIRAHNDRENAKQILRNFVDIYFTKPQDHMRKHFASPMFRAGFSLYITFVSLFQVSEQQYRHSEIWRAYAAEYNRTKGSKPSKGGREHNDFSAKPHSNFYIPKDVIEQIAPYVASATFANIYYQQQNYQVAQATNGEAFDILLQPFENLVPK